MIRENRPVSSGFIGAFAIGRSGAFIFASLARGSAINRFTFRRFLKFGLWLA